MKSITSRFLVTLGAALLAASAFGTIRGHYGARADAEALVQAQFELALAFELALREYVGTVVRPRVAGLLPPDGFVPEITSTSYVAREVFERVRRRYPWFHLRFASLNPRNPGNLATAEERRLLEWFAADPTRTDWHGELTVGGERLLGYSRVRRVEPSCLACHGEPGAAPRDLVRRYGASAGFGWRVGETMALDTVAIPANGIDAAIGGETVVRSLFGLALVVLVSAAAFVAFRVLVLRRLRALRVQFETAGTAPEAGLLDPVRDTRDDEIGALGRAFNALARRVAGSHARLEDAVRERTAELQRANETLERQAHERALADERLRLAQKLEAIGLLAGGVAHDFNNLLTTIQGSCEFLADELPAELGLDEEVREIQRAATRAATLTRQLLAFSRRQELTPDVLDANAVIADVSKMLRRLIGEHIELVLEPAPELPPVVADPGQLEQILMNLVVNARDAMPNGGQLTLRTGLAAFDAGDPARPAELEPGRYVRITVADTGVGMDAATAARAFEPFFTTKEFGRGTGLGLATVYGIVRQSGGAVTVQSAVGVGTTFAVYLPIAHPAEGAADTPSAAAEAPAQGSETVLVAEDEKDVAVLVRRILERAGYQVLLTSGPGETLLAAELHPGPIHLLVTDVVMPRMSGPDLAARLQQLRPGLPVLFMSGYTAAHPDLAALDGTRTAFLDKPFRADVLTRRVRELLDAAREPAEPR